MQEGRGGGGGTANVSSQACRWCPQGGGEGRMYRGPALELLTELPRTLLVLVAPGISEVCAP